MRGGPEKLSVAPLPLQARGDGHVGRLHVAFHIKYSLEPCEGGTRRRRRGEEGRGGGSSNHLEAEAGHEECHIRIAHIIATINE